MQVNDQNERSWYLASKAITRELTQEETIEWQELLRSDAEFSADYNKLKLLWDQAGGLPYGEIDIRRDWEKVRGRVKGRSFKPMYKYAATISLLLVAAMVLWKYGPINLWGNTQVTTTVIQAPSGSQSYVVLPDSSEVWINAGSKLIFDNQFGISNRKLTLVGEAFFDVEEDEVPFTVFTPDYDIKVLGTAFNIRAYEDDKDVVTTLVRGSLKVNNIYTAEGMRSTTLKPGDKLTLLKDTKTARLERGINVNLETSWKDGWLTVSSESLGELAKKLERLYDINITFKDEELKSYRYTGKIKQLSLEQVLKALALTSPVKFDVSEKTVTIGMDESEKQKYRSLQNPNN
ncbi:FecR family protein [Fulvivirga ligni]|uniref:FecR family protein n=1 Tax=Fulvivirga ligni TaxID=2904246 RepID=UPI001F468D07|nr:FecR domain-containing protein [Fulvivirga ligni]UII23171.1 DUF4974 domain-containing protein [Fulvivirga ligni]